MLTTAATHASPTFNKSTEFQITLWVGTWGLFHRARQARPESFADPGALLRQVGMRVAVLATGPISGSHTRLLLLPFHGHSACACVPRILSARSIECETA